MNGTSGFHNQERSNSSGCLLVRSSKTLNPTGVLQFNQADWLQSWHNQVVHYFRSNATLFCLFPFSVKRSPPANQRWFFFILFFAGENSLTDKPTILGPVWKQSCRSFNGWICGNKEKHGSSLWKPAYSLHPFSWRTKYIMWCKLFRYNTGYGEQEKCWPLPVVGTHPKDQQQNRDVIHRCSTPRRAVALHHMHAPTVLSQEWLQCSTVQ